MAGGQTHPNAHPYKLEPPVADRMVLEAAPRERTVQCYAVTRAAQRALSLLSESPDSEQGGFFWLADPPGAGKTHFMSYFLALRQRLAPATRENGRELVLAFDYPEAANPMQLEHDILTAVARQLGGGERRGTPLWRRIGPRAVFEVAMGEARRAGVLAFTVAIDFGLNEAPPFAADLVRIARDSKRPSLMVIAAGRGVPPADAAVAEIGPADLAEQMVVAIGRARRLEPRCTELAQLYRQIKLAPFAPDEIFPFHPETLRAVAALIEPAPSVAGLARMAREMLSAHRGVHPLLYPCDLFEVPELRRMVENRLGTDGRAALRNANAAVQSMPRASRLLAEQIVQILVLAHLCGRAPALEIDQLWAWLPPPGAYTNDVQPTRLALLHDLAARSGGAITASPVGAGFVPAHESSADAEQFNKALPLLKLLDPAAGSVHDGAELNAAIARLDQSLANLIEEAQAVAATLKRFAASCETQLEPGVTRAIDALVELARNGARGLVEQGAADDKHHAAAQAVAVAYQDLVAAAASVPALLAMREYLEQTRLVADNADRREAPEILALAAERSLFEAELGARAPYSRTRDSLRARFEKFKWTYIEHYRAAHERWRREMEKASALLIDIDRCRQSLMRLDSITALGPALGGSFGPQCQEAQSAVRVCTLQGEFNAQARAVCPQCGYVLGTPPPAPRLAELLEKIRGAMREKLNLLSRGAIARLIKKYDRAHRLDGFLKITQAAQTEALAAVLDDQLTAYLARLLQERGEAAMRKRNAR
jgi:hypothetical protein